MSRLEHKPMKQEVVKLDVVSDDLPMKMEQNACVHVESSKDSIIEIVLPTATIRFINNTDEMLFKQTLQLLGGSIC